MMSVILRSAVCRCASCRVCHGLSTMHAWLSESLRNLLVHSVNCTLTFYIASSGRKVQTPAHAYDIGDV